MSMYHVEVKPIHIGRFQLPLLRNEIMMPLEPGDTVALGEEKVTVLDCRPDRQVPTKLCVGDQVIDLEEEKECRFPLQGNQFVALRHVRALDF